MIKVAMWSLAVIGIIFVLWMCLGIIKKMLLVRHLSANQTKAWRILREQLRTTTLSSNSINSFPVVSGLSLRKRRLASEEDRFLAMVCYFLDDQMCLDTFSGEFTLEDALAHVQALDQQMDRVLPNIGNPLGTIDDAG